MAIDDKAFEKLQADFIALRDDFEKNKGAANLTKNIASGVTPITGTVNTGDTDTDTTINKSITQFNLLIKNIQGQ